MDDPDAWSVVSLDALCREIGTEVFFSKQHAEVARAVAVCEACPITKRCLDQALEAESARSSTLLHGIFGGLTADQRRPLVRRRRRQRRTT